MIKRYFYIAAIAAVSLYADTERILIIAPAPVDSPVASETFSLDGFDYGQAVTSPSLMSTRSAGRSESPQFLVRGLDAIQNRVFLEGVPLHTGQFQNGDLTQIPEAFVGGVELFAEGVPSHLMEDGMGGALQLRLRELSQSQVQGIGGSYGYAELSGIGVSEQVSLGLDARRAQEDFVYFDNNGTPLNGEDDRWLRRENNGYLRATALPRFVWAQGEDRLSVWSLNGWSEIKTPGPTYLIQPVVQERLLSLSSLNYRRVLPPFTWSSLVYLRLDSRVSEGPSSGLLWPANQSESADQWGAQSVLTFQWTSKVSLMGAVGVRRENYHRAFETLEGRQDQFKTVLPVALRVTGKSGPLSVQGEAFFQASRLEGKSSLVIPQLKMGTISQDYWLASPRLSLGYLLLPELRFRLNGGRYFRQPSFYELFGGPNGVEPNAELAAETGWKTSVGLDYRSGSWEGAWTVAAARLEDQITFAQNSQSTFVAMNLGQSEIYTQELSVAWKPPPFSVQVGWTWLNAWNKTPGFQNGKMIPYRPEHRVRFSAGYGRRPWRFGYQLSWVGPRFLDVANTRQLEGSWDHQIFATYTLRRWGSLALEIQNLVDSVQLASTFRSSSDLMLDNASGYPGYPAPGRRVYLKWTVPL